LKLQIELLMIAKRCAARGTTVVAVLHDLNLATLFAERIMVMQDGQVERNGSPRQVVTTDMVARVFGIGTEVGRVPPDGVPFVLPQAFASPADARTPSTDIRVELTPSQPPAQ